MNGLNIFGFEIRKIPQAPSISPERNDDGALEQNVGSGAAHFGYAFDINKKFSNEVDLINRYRSISLIAEIDQAIEDITTEAIVVEEEKLPVTLEINATDAVIPKAIKEAIIEEHQNVMSLMKFNTEGHDLFRQWYVDGRISAQMLVDEQNLSDGIKDIVFIDPRKIKKVRDVIRERSTSGIDVVMGTNEYFLFNDTGINSSTNGVKISSDVMLYAVSGKTDESGNVISYLHGAIKPANNLRYMEDAVLIYTLARAPERRAFYIDVADMTKPKAEQYIRDVMNRYKNKIVYDQQTGEVKSDRAHACLTMDTKVPLLDGRTLTLDEISKEYQDKELWAYSCDPITGKFAPGKITWAGVARPNAQIIRLTLDNGKTIECTYDHKFPVWNKGLVQAQDLSVGDSMIPLYRKQERITKNYGNTYEMIWSNDTKEWNYTHRIVSGWKDEVGIPNTFSFKEEYLGLPQKTVHHMDINRYNNSPSNLIRMNGEDHKAWHRSSGSGSGKVGGRRASDLGKSQQNFAKGRKIFAELMKDETFHAAFCEGQKANWTESQREAQSNLAVRISLSAKGNAAQKEMWKTDEKRDAHKAQYATSYTKEMFDVVCKLIATMSKEKIAAAISAMDDLMVEWKTVNSGKCINSSQKAYDAVTKHDIVRMVEQFAGCTFKELKDQVTFRNHKIAKIEYLDELKDTGCLTIDGNEEFHDYHTFALDVGIYSQNSLLEDYWLPRRSNGRTTEITTLPGSSIMSQMDNVNYFLNKLYSALNLPRSRTNPDGGFMIGRSTEISRDEVKFSKFIARLRRKFSEIFYQALRAQLVLKGIIAPEDWPFIKSKLQFNFLRDNYFAELKENEILAGRIQMAEQLQPYVGKYYSNTYIQHRILKLSEEEAEQMEKELAVEMQEHPEWFDVPEEDTNKDEPQ